MSFTSFIRLFFPCYGRDHEWRQVERRRSDGAVGWTEGGRGCRRCGTFVGESVLEVHHIKGSK